MVKITQEYLKQTRMCHGILMLTCFTKMWNENVSKIVINHMLLSSISLNLLNGVETTYICKQFEQIPVWIEFEQHFLQNEFFRKTSVFL